MSRALWIIALALTCFMAGPVRAAAYDDFVKSYLPQLAAKSVNGSTPRGMNPDPHFLTIAPAEWYDIEQAAVSGFSWGEHWERNIVGGAFRSHANGSWAAWGIATEAVSAPDSIAHLVGAEIVVASRNGNSDQAVKWGLPIIFGNRATGNDGPLEGPIGKNAFNENAKAVLIQGYARSPAGEYSGWQTGIYFDKTSMDRTVSKPYASAIDVSDVQSQGAPWYLVTYRCGTLRCGLKASVVGIEIWRDIDGPLPKLVKVL
jgi:hypothetical protein